MFVAINSVVLFIICIFFALLLIDTQVEILLAFEIIPHFATQYSSYTQPCMQTYQIFDRLFFFSGKHLSPGLQKQHICFAARLGFIAFQGRQSQTNTFSSQRYTFSSCSLLVFSFFKLLRRAF